MKQNVETALLNFYSSEILEIVDNQDEFTRSDLQGAIEAIVLTLLRGNHREKSEQILRMGA